MLKKTVVLLAFTGLFIGCNTVFAAGDKTEFATQPKTSGIYAGIGIGGGIVNAEFKEYTRDNAGLAGNANLGYQFNKYLGLEAGFAMYSKSKADGKDLATNNYAFDLAAKGIIPLGSGFDAFAKLGAAMVHTKWASTIDGQAVPDGGKSYTEPTAYFAAGFDYALTQHFLATLQGTATTNGSHVPSMFAGTVGVTCII